MSSQNQSATFAFGALAGVLGGFMLGIFFGKYVLKAISVIYRTFASDDGSGQRDRFKFELMLQ